MNIKLVSLLAIISSLQLACVPTPSSAKTAAESPVTLTAENARVVIAPDAGTVVRFAADEMTNFLAQALGGDIAVVTKPERGKVNLILGTNAWSAARGVYPEALPRDSFITKVLNGGDGSAAILISGCDDTKWDIRAAWKRGDAYETRMDGERATLFGVYDFLERYAGVRFYFPGPLGTIVPQKASLTIPVGTTTETPDFFKRMRTSSSGAPMIGDEVDRRWDSGRQLNFIQLLRSRRFTQTPLVHAIRHMSLKERFGKTHPEYFYATRDKKGNLVRHAALDDRDCPYTHLCWTSGVMDEIYKDWVAYAKGLPPESRGIKPDGAGGPGVWPRLAYGAGVVALSPDDGFRGCECDACRAAYTSTERTAGSCYAAKLVWTRTAELAKRLKKDGIPLRVAQSAYSVTLKLPEGVDIPDNVTVGIAHVGPWAEAQPERQAKDLAEIQAWSKKAGGAKVSLHNWACKYSKTNIPDLPCWTPKAVGAYYARVAPWAAGVYMESLSDRMSHIYLNNYILGKITWNTKFDYLAAIDEHYELMFGPGAPEMKAFFEELEDLWVGKIASGKIVYNALGPVQVVPSKFEIWRSIYTAERLAKWERLFAAAAAKIGLGSMSSSAKDGSNSTVDLDLRPRSDNIYLRRLALMKRNVLDPIAEARKMFAEATDPAVEEARRQREGVKNLLPEPFACDYRVTDEMIKSKRDVGACTRLPFKFEPNTTYRISFFLEAEDVKPLSSRAFSGALVGVWSDKPMKWNFSAGNGAVTGSTAGRVHQEWIFKTGSVFEAKELTVRLRDATGRMKVDGLILEKVE